MSDGQEKTEGAEHTFISEWMNTFTNLWVGLNKSWNDASQTNTSEPKSEPEPKKR